jgi:stage II sporulation protein GA (sporulation sigma-E factor processing peptidase)
MSMETIYIDSLFFINLIINYLIILATGKICALPLKRIRYALSAGLGAVYSVLVILPSMGFLASVPMKLSLAGFMVLAAFGGERKIFRSAVVFLAVSAAFGGAVYAASMLGGTPRGDGLFVPVSLRILILSFAICYAALTLVFRRGAKKAQRQIINVKLEFRGKSIDIRALRDTGNELYDPLSGRSVSVAARADLMPLFIPEVASCLKMSDTSDAILKLGEIPGYAGVFRLIPYTSIGVSMSLLLAFLPDKLFFDGREVKDHLIALSPTRFGEGKEYSALI